MIATRRGRYRTRKLTDEPEGAINVRLPRALREHFRCVCVLRGTSMHLRLQELMEQEVADNRHLLGEE